MDPLRFLSEHDGFFTRAMARDAGYDDKAVSAMVRGRVWHRFRRGYYTFTDIWASLDELGRHRVRSRAVLHSLGEAVALSHVSGAVAHGIDIWGVDLSRVHVTRLDGGAGRVEGDVVHHVGTCLPDEVVDVDGGRALPATRCVIECGSTTTSEAALVLFNSLLRTGKAEPDDLLRQFEAMGSWPGVRHLHVPVRLARPGVDSVGESRGLWAFWSVGIPGPVVQYEARDSEGRLVGTCDWAWPEEHMLGEFDGKLKYGRLLKPGQEPGGIVFAEKHREDELREVTGYGMLRLIWSDYDRPRLIRARFDRLARRTA
ncbi:MAG TPA: type IV toxin-antitoxin system AbiEi family antitoxin domain-containing protein [Nocardioides sp.]|nr:type IV toxin-antitoxin system AbiEi family antitoxin domain-containing protein [Nocardioides sp.]